MSNTLFSLAQKPTEIPMIVVKKADCCPSDLWIWGHVYKDTIAYPALSNGLGFIAMPKNCNRNAKFSITSFDLTINNGIKNTTLGNRYTGTFQELQQGGTITISNCLVECSLEGQKSSMIALSEKVFYITPQPDTTTKKEKLSKFLGGEWELAVIKCNVNGDTIVTEPSGGPGQTRTMTLRPLMTIRFDYPVFKINEICLKCPMLRHEGRYTIDLKPYNGVDLFYLSLEDYRADKESKELTKSFNGYFTTTSTDTFYFIDGFGCELMFKRMKIR